MSSPIDRDVGQVYGDLTLLNTDGEIRNCVDADLLKSIIREYLDLLLTSAAVYEKDGSYAIGIFSSGWCRKLDLASRQLCDTSDHHEALNCGKWLCHESCWNISRASIERALPCDRPCNGGLRIYAVPIFAGTDVVGSINFGWGTPPRDPAQIEKIAGKYGVDAEELKALAAAYHERPAEVIEEAKRRLQRAAQLIGEIVLRKRVEADLRASLQEKQELIRKAEEARVAAEIANAAKTRFLANMSHEIRTPISIILGYLELMTLDSLSQEESQEAVSIALKNCEHLIFIVNDILDLSRVEAGKIEVHVGDVDIRRVIEETISLFRGKAASKGLFLRFQSTPKLPRTIRTDETRLRQILVNLVGNAIKFTMEGGITISAQIEHRPDSENAFLMSVRIKDTGCGVTADDRERLFEPFVQGDSLRVGQVEGSGLGLALSRRLARALGGDLMIEESELGAGSTFCVQISPGSFDELNFYEPVRRDELSEVPLDKIDLSARQFLVVEDNIDLQKRIVQILEGCGAKVASASNGHEGVEMARSDTFDLLLMDIRMPIMDGYTAIKTLRSEGYDRPILALTAHAMNEERVRLMNCGCNEYLTKPIRSSELLSAIERHLSNQFLNRQGP